ncbi:MAG: LacI family DNA-binding transcriptional regulator [Clostridia bacterium]|nr:LacI family DNA-binding transcriptional regulator [Clostridia bacterium]MBR6009161.1 LacI family DNA-binding transcriptional regulator [Clostridia bacterium]
MSKLRLSDIAKAAGVSTASVSNALNYKTGINTDKAESIRRLAAQMGYKTPAESDRRSMRFVIYRKHGKVVMDTAFFSQLIEGIQDECHRLGCDLLINKCTGEDDITELLDRPMLLLATEMDESDLIPLARMAHPVLLLDSDFKFESYCSVSIDNQEAGYLAAKYLVSKGHTDFGFLDSSLPFNNMEDRYRGFAYGLASEGFPEPVRIPVEPTVEGAYVDMYRYVENHTNDLPKALFAGNDIIAMGSIRALKGQGYKLPDDISIIGMDDMPMCQVIEPALSTIRVDKTRLGRIAVDRLWEMMKYNEKTPIRIRMGVNVVERESVRTVKPEE